MLTPGSAEGVNRSGDCGAEPVTLMKAVLGQLGDEEADGARAVSHVV